MGYDYLERAKQDLFDAKNQGGVIEAMAEALIAIAERTDNSALIILELPSGHFVNLAGLVKAVPYEVEGHVDIRLTWDSGAAEPYYGGDARHIINYLKEKGRKYGLSWKCMCDGRTNYSSCSQAAGRT